ncbi:MAG: SPFH domain-containing protein [Phycisphaerales bacterium]
MPQLAQIIEFQDTVGDVLAARLPATGEGVIEWGSQLIVREGQVAVFFRDGKAMATFEPGRYVLTTQNVPVLTKFVTGMVYGKGNTPFRAEVYYVATSLHRDLKWGTPSPVYIPDPILLQIPIRANGRFAIRVTDPSIFVPKVVGTRPIFRTRDIEDYLRAQYIVAALTDGVASLGKSFVELPRYYRELGIGVKAIISPEVATLGVEMTELAVNSVSTTEEIRQVLDRNAGIASEAFARARGTQLELEAKAAGAARLAEAGTSYQQVGMADAMKTMAANPGQGSGGGGSSAMDTGVNLGLAMMMPQMMGQMMQNQQPAAGAAPAQGQNPAGVAAVATQADPFAKLKQLKELLDMGAITKEDFEAKKAELLKSI